MESPKTKAFNVAILRLPTGGARRFIVPNSLWSEPAWGDFPDAGQYCSPFGFLVFSQKSRGASENGASERSFQVSPPHPTPCSEAANTCEFGGKVTKILLAKVIFAEITCATTTRNLYSGD